MKRGQTSTEYIIILAIVIVIAVVVGSILGDLPGVGSGTSKKVDDYKLTTAKVAVHDYASISNYSLIKLKNNHYETLTATAVNVNGEDCDDNSLPATLGIGKSITLNCSVNFTGTPSINIVWEDISTGATYATGETVTSSNISGESSESSEWVDLDSPYKQEINISVFGSTNQDFQIPLSLSSSNVGPNFEWANGLEDIRFYSQDESVELDYWTESVHVSGETAIVWVEVDENITNNSIYFYYGNNTYTSDSDGPATFIIFDTFSDGDYTAGDYNWDSYSCGTGYISETSGRLEIKGNWNSNRGYARSSSQIYEKNIKLMYRARKVHSSACQMYGLIHWDGTGTGSYCSPSSSFRLITSYSDSYTLQVSPTSGSATTINSTTKDTSDTGWHNHSIAYYDGFLKTELDGEFLTGYNSTNFSTTYIGFSGREQSSYYSMIDDVRLARYHYPEPSIVYGSETSRS